MPALLGLLFSMQLDDKPIQHREVMGYESDLFKSYFKTVRLLEGGLVLNCIISAVSMVFIHV